MNWIGENASVVRVEEPGTMETLLVVLPPLAPAKIGLKELKQFETCLKIDRNFPQARDALKRLQSSGQSNWHDWWFKDADNASYKNQISSISGSLINISFAKVLSLNSSSHESASRHLCVRKVCPREISIIKLYVRKICSR